MSRDIEDIYELSPAQQGILFHSLYAPDSAEYFVQACCTFAGNLNLWAFESAWQQVVQQQAILRTTFHWQDLEKPLQVVHLQAKLTFNRHDWRGLSLNEQKAKLEAFLQADCQQGFDLNQAPLMRLTLLQLSEDTYHFIWSKHHLILDGWSSGLVFKAVLEAYQALCQGNISVSHSRPYADYIEWLQHQDKAAAEAFWRQTLEGFTAPSRFGIDSLGSSSNGSAEYCEQKIALDTTATAALQSLGRKYQLTLNTIVQGCWGLLLSRYSGEDDIVFGATTAGRPPDLNGVESMVGVFINTLPVRLKVTSGQLLIPWLLELQAHQVEARQYDYTPLVQVQQWSQVAPGVPLFESILVFENQPIDPAVQVALEQGGVKVRDVRPVDRTNYPLSVVVEVVSSLSFRLGYDRHRFEDNAIARMLGHLITLLKGIAANPHRCLTELPLLTAAEQHQILVEWNDTYTDYPLDKCIHQLFEEQVLRSPDAVAVIFDNQQLTYRELNQQANQLAHYLQNLGVDSEVLVGICVERSLFTIVGILGILKAGAAYVPLDPSYPKERLAFMLTDAQLPILLTQSHLVDGLPKHQAKIVCLDAQWQHICQASEENLVNQVKADNLAYVIYTSGSTGKPKGVIITHQAVVNHNLSVAEKFRLKAGDRVLQFASISFDVAVEEIFPSLLSGATIVLPPNRILAVGKEFLELIETAKLSVLNLPASYWHEWVKELSTQQRLPESLRLIIVGSEKISSERFKQCLQYGGDRIEWFNAYGTTESTVTATLYQLNREIPPEIPIGRPIANTQIYLLDRHLSPVPVGVPGEIYIGGVGLARGYLNQPQLTAEKFIPNPFSKAEVRSQKSEVRSQKSEVSSISSPASPASPAPPALNSPPHPFTPFLYKTGDKARYLPDGNIEYLDRIDNQVKIRGFRIELGEIEAVLLQHPAISEAHVAVFGEQSQLVAYVVPDGEMRGWGDGGHDGGEDGGQRGRGDREMGGWGDAFSSKAPPAPGLPPAKVAALLGQFLKQKLPEYMIPAAFVMLERLPLTPNGKVDKRSLPSPDRVRSPKADFADPRTPIEEILAQIWAAVLQLNQVGIHDNFFELGGHSLSAIQVISQVRLVFAIELPLRCMFATPTIAGLAQSIDATLATFQSKSSPPIERVSQQVIPLSFAQARLWFLDQLQPGNPAYNIPAAVRLTGDLNIAALEQSLNEIVSRHEALRTNFVISQGQPCQQIAPALTLTLPVIDLRQLPPADRKAQLLHFVKLNARQPFDLEREALLRTTLLQLDETEYVFVVIMHHIVSDAWSMGIFIQELAALYAAFSTGKPSPLPELPIQYKDFAIWQHQWMQGEVLETQLSYWRQQLGDRLPVLQLNRLAGKKELNQSKGASSSFLLPLNLSESLKELSRSERVTLFMILVAALQTLLHRYSGEDDIVIGTDVANRNRAETELAIGFFINLLVLRTDLSGNPTFRGLLHRVREVALGAYTHQDLPFAKLVEELRPERNTSHTPLFQVLLVLQNTPMPSLELPGLTMRSLECDTGMSKFDLALFATETATGIDLTWRYNTQLFDEETLAQMSADLETLLTSMVAAPDTQIDNVEMRCSTQKQKQQMKTAKQEGIKKFMQVKPKAVMPQGELIKTSFLQTGQNLPLVLQPNVSDFDVIDWAQSNREFLETQLLKHGAILFRGFNLTSASAFENLAQAICPDLFANYGDLPRAGASDKVYTSTPYPPEQAILFHNESSHLHQYPLKIWFFCQQPAEKGGETPIVDCRQVYQMLDPQLRSRFEQKQLMYVRNYTDGLDVSWQNFFHTCDKTVVKDYCRQSGTNFEWKPGNGLRTRKIRKAIAKHPKTGESVFFNQIQLHHFSCLDPAVRKSLLSLFEKENLPRHVYYGDGSEIEDSVIAEICQIYQEATISFPWQQGDVLMLDNMLTAHGRNPYTGSRKIVVAMGEMAM